MKKHKLGTEIMPDSVCGKELALIVDWLVMIEKPHYASKQLSI